MLLTVFISLVIIGIVILLYYIFTLQQFLRVRKGISRISYLDDEIIRQTHPCLLYTSPSPRDS